MFILLSHFNKLYSYINLLVPYVLPTIKILILKNLVIKTIRYELNVLYTMLIIYFFLINIQQT